MKFITAIATAFFLALLGMGAIVVLFLALLGGSSSGSNSGEEVGENEIAPSLNSEQEEYLDQRAAIEDQAVKAANDQLDIYDVCNGGIYYCESYREELLQNEQEVFDLLTEAQNQTPPDGYGESHDTFLHQIELLYKQVQNVARVPVEDYEIDRMIENANATNDISEKELPLDAQEYLSSR
jgi:hypothetical protein